MSDVRNFCKPIDYQFNCKIRPTSITRWEKFLLFFVKKNVDHNAEENSVMIWKKMNGKIYILDYYFIPSKGYNCRHNINEITPKP